MSSSKSFARSPARSLSSSRAEWPRASAASAARLGSGSQIAGDHDSDRLHPAGHIKHGAEPALFEDVVAVVVARTNYPLPSGFLDAKELETFVVFVVAARYGREVGPRARLTSRTGFTWFSAAFPAASA